MGAQRLNNVDIIRGFAVLWMVLFQTLDFFSRDFQMYSVAVWTDHLDFVNWFPIFIFVSGVSVWLMVDKRLSSGSSRLKVLAHGLKRYGFYVFLSFLLCLWVFNLDTFLSLNEIVAAIGVYAAVTLCLLLVIYKRELILIPLMFAVYGLSYWFRSQLSFQYYPFYWTLPIFFMGALFAKLTSKKEPKKWGLMLLLLFLTFWVMVAFGDDFRYSSASLGFAVFNVALVVIYWPIVDEMQNAKPLGSLRFAGRNPLFFYLFHYAVLYKIAVTFNVFQKLDWPTSILITLSSIALIYPLACLESRLIGYLKRRWSKGNS